MPSDPRWTGGTANREWVIVGRDALEEIVGNLGTVTLIRAGNERADEDAPFGELRYPAEVADAIWRAMGARFREKLQGPPVALPAPVRFEDAEVDALAVIVDRIAVLQAETGGETVQRVIRYLCDRYGTDG